MAAMSVATRSASVALDFFMVNLLKLCWFLSRNDDSY